MSKLTTILLAGGAATRLRPLSNNIVKAMVPLMGKPLLLHIIRLLQAAKLTHLVVSSTGRHGEIKNYFGDGSKFGVDIHYCVPTGWNHTAGTVRDIVRTMADDISDPFLVVYSDSLLRADFSAVVDFHRENASECTILYHQPEFAAFPYEYHDSAELPDGERTNFGVMNLRADKTVTYFEEKPLLKDIEDESKFPFPVANAAVYMLNKRVLTHIDAEGQCDFAKYLFPKLLENNVRMFGCGVGPGGYRIDMGLLAHYFSFQMALLEQIIEYNIDLTRINPLFWMGGQTRLGRNVHVIGQALVGDNSIIEDSTVLDHVVIGNHCHISRGADVRRCIIYDNVRIGSDAIIRDAIIDEYTVINDRDTIDQSIVNRTDTVRIHGSLQLDNVTMRGLIGRP